jgi:hypothetical protein
MQHKSNSITLYDGGGWFILLYLFGLPVLGSVLDYIWNYAVLYFTLRWLPPSSIRGNTEGPGLNEFIGGAHKRNYTILITILGFIIDWIYYDIMWRTLPGPHMLAEALIDTCGNSQTLILLSFLAAIVALAIVNFALSRLYLKLKAGQAAILGAVMGIFTAPWVILIIKIIEHN